MLLVCLAGFEQCCVVHNKLAGLHGANPNPRNQCWDMNLFVALAAWQCRAKGD